MTHAASHRWLIDFRKVTNYGEERVICAVVGTICRSTQLYFVLPGKKLFSQIYEITWLRHSDPRALQSQL